MKLPMDHFNAELARMGRSLNDATILAPYWLDDELGLIIAWPDCLKFVGLGPEASIMVRVWREIDTEISDEVCATIDAFCPEV